MVPDREVLIIPCSKRRLCTTKGVWVFQPNQDFRQIPKRVKDTISGIRENNNNYIPYIYLPDEMVREDRVRLIYTYNHLYCVDVLTGIRERVV